eukprot:1139018-Pelagomonas_calceolata.AAC.16
MPPRNVIRQQQMAKAPITGSPQGNAAVRVTSGSRHKTSSSGQHAVILAVQGPELSLLAGAAMSPFACLSPRKSLAFQDTQ